MEEIEQFKKYVFDQMISRDRQKYFYFVQSLKLFRAIGPKTKGELLESYYVLMRYIDDIVDGDIPLPVGYQNATSYIEKRIDFISNRTNSSDISDKLLAHCFLKAEKSDMDISRETQDILLSMLWDAKRYKTDKIFPASELNEHFYMLDIRGTIRGTAMMFNENPDYYLTLKDLGDACRIQYNLGDFKDDVSKGYINISQEDFFKYKLTMNDLKISPINNKVKEWFIDQSLQGKELISSHKQNLPDMNLKKFTRLALRYVYELPASKYFDKVLLNKL